MKDGWYPWVNRDGDQLGVLHYFEVWAGNPDYDDDELQGHREEGGMVGCLETAAYLGIRLLKAA